MRRVFFILGFSSVTLIPGCQCSRPPVHETEAVTPNPVSTAAADLVRRQHLETLRAGVDKGLRELEVDQTAAIKAALRVLVPGRDPEGTFGYQPEQVREVTLPGGARLLVLLERLPCIPHPGSSHLRLTVFDEPGRVSAESTFTTGHRCYLHDFTVDVSESGSPLFVLRTGEEGLGPDVSKQVCALIDGRFSLVRVEDSDGFATRNRYYVSHFTCGPKAAGRTAAEWEADLFADDRLRVLRALVWLGGWHWDYRPDEKADRQQEDIAEVRLVREVREKQAVTARLAELAKSGDTWIREAAELAKKPQDTRF